MEIHIKTCLKQWTAELLGTFFLTFSILSAISSSASSYVQIVWVHGFAIFNLGLIFGPISGGHFNPAVSFGMLISKWVSRRPNEENFSILDFCGYSIFQLLGGILAGLVNFGLFKTPYYDQTKFDDTNIWIGPLGNSNGDNSYVACFFFEVLGTALLVLSIKMTNCKRNDFVRKSRFDFFAVLIIAGMITYIGFMGILYYAGINPAREFGPRIAGAIFFGADRAFTSYTWIPIVGPFVGAVGGVIGFEGIRRMYPGEITSKNVDGGHNRAVSEDA